MQEHLSSGKVVFRNALANLLGFGGSTIYLLLLVPLVVRYAGVEQFGLWTLMVAVTGYVGLIDAGLNHSFIKFISEYLSTGDTKSVNKVISHGLIFYSGIFILMLSFGFLLGEGIVSLLNIPPGQGELAFRTLMLAIVVFGLSALLGVFGAVLAGLQRSDILNVQFVVVMAVKLAAIYAALSAGYGITGMLLAEIAVTLVSFVPLCYLTRQSFRGLSLNLLEFDGAMMKRLIRFGSQIQLSRFAELVQTQFDKLLLARHMGLTTVSIYEFGARPLSRLRILPLTPVSALLPAFSALDAGPGEERFDAIFARATRYLMIIAVPLFVLVACFAPEFIRLWIGEGYDDSAMTMQILVAGVLMNVSTGVLSHAALGRGKPKFQMWSMLTQAVLQIALAVLLLRVIGFYGVVIGNSIATTIGAVLFIRLCGDEVVRSAWKTTFGMMVRPIVAAIAAAAGALAFRALLLSTMDAAETITLVTIAGCGSLLFLLLYTVVLGGLKGFSRDDIQFVRNILPGQK